MEVTILTSEIIFGRNSHGAQTNKRGDPTFIFNINGNGKKNKHKNNN